MRRAAAFAALSLFRPSPRYARCPPVTEMRLRRRTRAVLIAAWCVIGVLIPTLSIPADHNDPNAINSIFWDVPVNAADLYDLFGFPSDDSSGGDRVVVALTFAAAPGTGVLDPDLLYRILFAPAPRVALPAAGDHSLTSLLGYFDAVKAKYLGMKPYEVRVRIDQQDRQGTRAKIDFIGFPGGALSQLVDLNKSVALTAPDGSTINAFVGGRDDAFFNDLPGFFRSINYAPQFYKVPQSMTDMRELKIPKTLLELDGNTLFNYDPQNPLHGQGVKKDLPQGPLTWNGHGYKKDANGKYRFVYSGKDAQAGRNVNAIILEIPLRYLTKTPAVDRIVNTWGESWVLKASGKIKQIPDEGAMLPGSRLLAQSRLIGGVLIAAGLIWIVYAIRRRNSPRPPSRWIAHAAAGLVFIAAGVVLGLLHQTRPGQEAELERASMREELQDYKLVDTDGQPFADAGLNEREDARQVGANNFLLGPHFITRLAHLGWGFAPSISALGLKTAFDHDNSPVSVYRTYTSVAEAFPRVQKMLFQTMNMPDGSWNKRGVNIPLRRAFEVFVPNVCAIDMDTTGTWPFGRRLEDQVATRFLSIFLDMDAEFNGQKYNVETLQNQAALDTLPMEPRTPPNPLKNDKEFLRQFPYLAEPWPASYTPASR
jgi:hypothetical protein